MYNRRIILLGLLSVFLQQHPVFKATATFDPHSKSNFVNYWGQNAAAGGDNPPNKWQKSIDTYCQDETEDILVISFLFQFGSQELSIDLSDSGGNCQGYFPGTQLLDCPFMESDIKYCQSKDKLILLSLGGATGTYGLSSDSEGQKLADSLWNLFGGGQSDTRPFGSASVDGFDLDIEAGETRGYTAFVKRMRDHYSSDSSKNYYVSAAPQCPYPDKYLSEALNSAWFDFVWVQFYNNFCAVNSNQFNYDRWDRWAREESVNRQVKLFIGVPASSYAANDGFVSYEELITAITETRNKYDSFGGVMMWDVSAAYANTQDAVPNFAEAVAKFLHQNNDDSSANLHTTKSPTRTRATATLTTSTFLDNDDRMPANTAIIPFKSLPGSHYQKQQIMST